MDGDAGAYFQAILPDIFDRVMDPDLRKRADPTEPAKHFFDMEDYIDRGVEITPVILPRRTELDLGGVLAYGTLPWAIMDSYERLSEALRTDSLLMGVIRSAADLAHYVGDLSQPFHTTRNHNGQWTWNDGIHGRYEITLLDAYRSSIVIKAHPEWLDDDSVPVKLFNILHETNRDVEKIIAADGMAYEKAGDYNGEYYRALWSQTSGEMGAELSRGSDFLAELYAAAWEKARSNRNALSMKEELVTHEE